MSVDEERIEKIKLLFRKLKEAYDWGQSVLIDTLEEETEAVKFYNNKLMPTVEQIIEELEGLEVPQAFSRALFIFGDVDVAKYAKQF